MKSLVAPLTLGLVLLPSCAPRQEHGSARPQVAESSQPKLPDGAQELVRLPAGWATMSAPGFERLAQDLLPGDLPRRFTDAGHATLASALTIQDAASVRAAVLLVRSQTPEAKSILLDRLETRDLGPHRDSDAGDATAAAGLGSFELSADDLNRLTALVLGGVGEDAPPHPDVEVRVEMARVLLERGRTGGIPFLLRVLLDGTKRGLLEPVDWERKENMAWSKSRATEALCTHLETEIRYDPDGAFAAMEAE
ncbi:MAG: hypothetical protein AAF368_17290, partial [Planctomycetota bacterium]